MVLPPIKIDTGIKQFQNLKPLYNNAHHSLTQLRKLQPERADVWLNVTSRLGLIQQSIETKTLPTASEKKQAELSTMLNFECQDLSGTGKLTALFELDNAYQLLGIEPLSTAELSAFSKKMGCQM